MSRSLIIFIKNPILGHCKTRIANDVGDERALEIYQSLLDHTHRVTMAIDAERFLYYSQQIEEDQWSTNQFQKFLQVDGDLGDRLTDACSRHLIDDRPTLILGSDCLELSPQILNRAFDCLATADLVMGPCADGGYYLMGLKKMYPALFNHIRWSSSDTLNDTLINAEKLGLCTSLLPVLNDIDTIDDWNRYHGNN